MTRSMDHPAQRLAGVIHRSVPVAMQGKWRESLAATQYDHKYVFTS
jgi:hypothetical protein